MADTYHAMTSDRPYRSARSSFEALKELRIIAGDKLDKDYIEILAQVLRDKDLAYRDGTSTDFMGEYERGRINLRLRGKALADVSGLTARRKTQRQADQTRAASAAAAALSRSAGTNCTTPTLTATQGASCCCTASQAAPST